MRLSHLNDARSIPLFVLIAGVVLAGLAFIASIPLLGYDDFRTPHTAQSAQLVKARGIYDASERNPEAWYSYVSNMIGDRAFNDAQALIDAVPLDVKRADTYDHYVEMAQAALLFAQRNYTQALDAAQSAQTAMKQAYTLKLKSTEMPNIARSTGISANYWELYLLKAGAYKALGKTNEEITALRVYLEKYPTSAGVWSDLGEALEQAGDSAGAVAAYKKTLKYIPDDKTAREALARLED